MKAFCCECGRPVRQIRVGDEWKAGSCSRHPFAKRYAAGFAAKWFRKMHDLCAGELAAQIEVIRDCRKPYLPKHVSELLAQIRGGAL